VKGTPGKVQRESHKSVTKGYLFSISVGNFGQVMLVLSLRINSQFLREGEIQTKAFRVLLLPICIGILAVFVGSCKDGGDGAAPTQPISGPVSFVSHVQPIFNASSVDAGCHPGGGAPFSLQAGVSYASLVNVPAVTGPCAGLPRVKPSSADSSALHRRLAGTCGAQMPLGGSPLPQSQRDLIRNWVNEGAQNN
jgi:hypothetical protein